MTVYIRDVTTHAFTGGGLAKHRVAVDVNSRTVRVLDNVAGYYTLCHVIPPSTQAKCLRLARRAAAQGQGIVDWGTR